MTTTAARSRDYMRKLGFIAECVEHRRGSFIRVDLFGFADVLAYKGATVDSDGKIILIQAYHRKEEKNHAHFDKEHQKKIWQWLEAGGKFEHHLWSFKSNNSRKYWSLERRDV